MFAVQDEIALNITGAITPGIISAEILQAQRKDPSQLDAWDRVMRAHWHIRRFTREDLAEARRLLDDAITLDPANSMALSDLAVCPAFRGGVRVGRWAGRVSRPAWGRRTQGSRR